LSNSANVFDADIKLQEFDLRMKTMSENFQEKEDLVSIGKSKYSYELETIIINMFIFLLI
jgi:hypothetical protein